MKLNILLVFVIISSTVGQANAATYSYYFSDSGSDAIGSGIQGSPWATLSQAKTAIDALGKNDRANLYFKRGDSWTWDSAAVKKQNNKFVVGSSNPIVNIDAYGTGNPPVFDGKVTDFSKVPVHNAATGPLKWNRFFEFRRDHCNVSNIEIKNVYGHGIFLNNANFFTVDHCKIHHFGSAAISFNGEAGLHDSTVKYSIVHTGQELYRHGKRPAYGGGIEFAKSFGVRAGYNNHIHHNLVYDIYGEGIICSNATTEYNIVGDTGTVGVDPASFRFDSLKTIVRYNLVVFSDRESIYNNFKGASPTGIRVYDEDVGGNNSAAVFEVYGNIVINRQNGIWFFHPEDPGNAFGTVKIYNNIVIDSVAANYVFSQAHEVKNGYFNNNSSILYDNPSALHIQDNGEFPRDNWHITQNHFWTAGGSPGVDPDWRDSYNTRDPKLLGAVSVQWTKLSGPTYYKDINPVLNLNPPPESPIYNLTPLLKMDINEFMKNLPNDGNSSITGVIFELLLR